MASFVGTFDEFIKYINPRAKNIVNVLARKHKKEVRKCEHCSSTTATLEAAHVTGRERKKIIEEVLDNFTNGEMVTVDLEVFESKFWTAHEPIEENILVLCRPCHTTYDVSNDAAVETCVEGTEVSLIQNFEITEYLRQKVPHLSDIEVANLESLEQCNSTFGVNFPVLKSVPINSNIEEIRNYSRVNGYNRWSTQRPVVRGNSKYLVLTQWANRHRRPFMTWQKRIENA